MVPPNIAALETLWFAELRGLVGTLLAKVAELAVANAALNAENLALRDEVARLKACRRGRPRGRPAQSRRPATPGRHEGQ